MMRMPNNKGEKKESGLNASRLHVLSELVSRAILASRMGYQYGTDRNLYKALGYPETEITFEEFLSRYLRQDIAKAVIDRPVKATWQGPLEILESGEKEDTPLEKAWRELDKRLSLKSKFARCDRLTGIGSYGVLLLGLNDVKKKEDFERPVNKNVKLRLDYVKPFSSKSAQISSFVSDSSNPRYGMPEIYDISVNDVESNNIASSIKVHYTRVIHVVEDPLESEIYGIPRLEAIYNRLMDLEKVVGGDAEMFWRGARPGYQGKVDKDYQMTPAAEADLKDQIDEFEHNLRRFLINEGIEISALEQQIADPSSHVDSLLKMISAVTSIPIRILVGSERGELASSQDWIQWLSYIQARREEFAEVAIVRPFVDKCIEYGILPKPVTGTYSVKWADPYAQSEMARVEIGMKRAGAIREYTYNISEQDVVPVDAFLEFCLGFTQDQIELIHQMREKEIEEEQDDLLPEEDDEINKEQILKKVSGNGND